MTNRPCLIALFFASSPTVLVACASEAPPGASRAKASADAPSVRAVEAALAGVEWESDAPGPAALAPGAEEVLMTLSRNPGDRPRVTQVRATLALRHHPNDVVADFLLDRSRRASTPDLRSAALEALGAGFVQSHPETVRAAATPHLRSDDPGIRRSAREAIARLRVRRFLPSE